MLLRAATNNQLGVVYLKEYTLLTLVLLPTDFFYAAIPVLHICSSVICWVWQFPILQFANPASWDTLEGLFLLALTITFTTPTPQAVNR
jgi:hypothetical protein